MARSYRALLEGGTLDENTAAGVVGAYHPPLGMSRRDQDKIGSKGSCLKRFAQCTGTMSRSDMLKQSRRMGMSLSHLKDDQLRKSLNGMSLRNKRKFMGEMTIKTHVMIDDGVDGFLDLPGALASWVEKKGRKNVVVSDNDTHWQLLLKGDLGAYDIRILGMLGLEFVGAYKGKLQIEVSK